MRFLIENVVLAVYGLDPQYNIDEIKKQCETYKEEMKYEEGEQMKI